MAAADKGAGYCVRGDCLGLDTVELVMEIEEAFSIRIPDDEASHMVTVGDVFDYILERTKIPANPSVCLSAAAFFSLRRAAMTLGCTKRLRPGDFTAAILPDSKRPQYWLELQKRCELTLPALQRPGWLVATSAAAVVACSAFFGFLVFEGADSQLAAAVAALAAGGVLGAMTAWITRPFAAFPPTRCRTLRGLAETALALNFSTLAERYHGANQGDLWIALRSMIVEQLGVSPEEVTPTARFVDDLGCD